MASKQISGNDEPTGDVRDAREDQQMDAMISQAVDAIEKGASPESVVGSLLESLPPHLQEKAKKRLRGAIENRKPSAGSLEKPKGLRALASLMAKQAFDKITSVLRTRPDVQRRVQEAGKTLMRNGVVVDMVRVSENDLGTLAPMLGVAQQKDRTVQR